MGERRKPTIARSVFRGLIATSMILTGCETVGNGEPTVNPENQPKPTNTSTLDLDGQPQIQKTVDPMEDVTVLMHPEEPNFCDSGYYPCINQNGPLCCGIDTEAKK